MNQLFWKLQPAIIAIETVDTNGDSRTGTGFHVGDGIVISARHVVCWMQSIKLLAPRASGGEVRRIVFPMNPLADVAIIQTDLDYSHYLEKTRVCNHRV